MKPAPLLEGEMSKERITCDVRGYGLTICQVERDAAGRIEQLLQRLRAQLGESPRKLPRAALLRTLLLRGLDVAEPQGIQIAPRPPRFVVRYECLLTGLEVDRLERFRQARWSRSTRPPTERLLGALVRRALPLAELDESLAIEVLGSRLPRAKDQP